jgi:hypothetical protein
MTNNNNDSDLATTAIRGSLLELDREHKSIYNPATPQAPAIDDSKVSVDRTVSERFFGTVEENADVFSVTLAGTSYVIKPTHRATAELFLECYYALPNKPCYDDFRTCLEFSGIEGNGLLPKLRTLKHYAGEAVRVVGRRWSLITCAEQGSSTRGYIARYHLGTKSGLNGQGEVGDAYGNRSCIVTLHNDGDVSFTGDNLVGLDIQAEFRSGIDGQTYTAQERKSWAKDIFVNVFGAHTAVFDRLMPITSCSDLAVGLANVIINDIATIKYGIDAQIKNATKRDTTLGSRAAINAIEALELVATKAKELRTLLNDDSLGRVVRDAQLLISFLDRYCDTTSVRGALIWNEIAAD